MALRTTTSPSPNLSVLWHGSFFVHHSLALVNRELTLALLDRGGLDLTLQNYEPAAFGSQSDPRLARLESRLRSPSSSPSITVRHLWPPDLHRPGPGKFVLVQPWEFGSLPRAWVEGIARSVDECWAPSQYVKQVYEASGVPADKVFVVPNGVNTDRFHPGVDSSPAQSFLSPDKSYKFLFVGGTIGRKGIDALLDAYTRAFTNRDSVTLIIKDFGRNSFYAGQDASALIAALQAKPGAPEIIHLTEDLDEAGIAALYASCDALVHPYRGEGYGLPIAEAMACGKPTIITGAGAALDFADDTTSYLVPAERVELGQQRIGDLETVAMPWWYEPDRNALASLMRQVYENPAEGIRLGATAAARIAENHTWAHAARIAHARLTALATETHQGRSAARPAALEPVAYHNRKQRAIALTREGAWQEAIADAEACLAVRPQDDDLINALAVAKYRSGDAEGAIALLQEHVERAPESRDFHHNLAFMLLARGEAEAALGHAIAAARLGQAEEVRQTLAKARDAAQKVARRIRKTAGRQDSHFRQLSALLAEADGLLSPQASEPAPALEPPAFRPARLSVVMIARNEEKFLEGCMQSVLGVADEIILVDTGSTDRTVEIATSFGAKVIHHAWNDDFSAARNISLQNATGDWALWLDADERLAEEQADLLRYLINAAEANVGGYMVNIRNFMTRSEHAEVCWHRACRLFRLDPRIRFTGRIHEQNMRGIQNAGYVCALSQLKLDHYGYAAEVMNERGKHERFIRMLTREVEENPDDTYRTFHLFNLGNAYFTRGDMHNAARWLSQAADGADPAEEYSALLFVEWATALYATGRAAEALDACDRAEKIGVDHPGVDFARGHAYLHLKQYISAERSFHASIERGKQGSFVHTGDEGAYTYKAYYGLALALTGQERHEESVEQCRLALAESSRFADARYLLANGLRRLDRLQEARTEFEELNRIAPAHSLCAVDFASTLFDLGDYPAAVSALRRASALQPGNLEICTKLGACCETLGLHEEARDAYIAARRMAPRSPEVLVNLGRAHASLGAHDRAIDCYTDAMYADPQYANAYFNAGDLLYQLGYYAKSAETLCAGLEVEPTNASGYLVLGNCFAKLGELPAARQAYLLAVTRRPDYSEALQNLQVVEEALSAQAA